jgi:hypothetical protein
MALQNPVERYVKKASVALNNLIFNKLFEQYQCNLTG